jgi:hypothetical protein
LQTKHRRQFATLVHAVEILSHEDGLIYHSTPFAG